MKYLPRVPVMVLSFFILLLAGCFQQNDDHYDLTTNNYYEEPTIISVQDTVDEGTIAGSCNDEKDNDFDELIDCEDPGCLNNPVCNPVENSDSLCKDGEDNDDDGDTDCDDSDCEQLAICQPVENTVELCLDNKDNDDDRDTDCDDDDCAELSVCQDEELNAIQCTDGVDNDSDGDIDCEDEDCQQLSVCKEETPEQCSDGEDNDVNGDADCDDEKCVEHEICQPKPENTLQACTDNVDNDDDDKIDCDDEGCKFLEPCIEITENTPDLCTDGEDNDDNGDTDCDDLKCQGLDACKIPRENTTETCSDNIDNDEDGDVDCDDDGCEILPVCVTTSDIVFKNLADTTSEPIIIYSSSIGGFGPIFDNAEGEPYWRVNGQGMTDGAAPIQTGEIENNGGGGWDMYYMQVGEIEDGVRPSVDFSEHAFKKLTFRAMTQINNVSIKIQWQGSLVGNEASFQRNLMDMLDTNTCDNELEHGNVELFLKTCVSDGKWRTYSVDFINVVGDKFNASQMTVPFAMVANAPGGLFRLDDIQLEGGADTYCFEVIGGNPEWIGLQFCDTGLNALGEIK